MARDEDRSAEAAAEAEAAKREAESARDDAAEQAERAERAEHAAELIAPLHDPVLDTGVRRIEAGVDEDNPYGRPGQPLSEQSPFRMAFVAAMGVASAALLAYSVVVARQVLVLILVAAFVAVGLDPAVR